MLQTLFRFLFFLTISTCSKQHLNVYVLSKNTDSLLMDFNFSIFLFFLVIVIDRMETICASSLLECLKNSIERIDEENNYNFICLTKRSLFSLQINQRIRRTFSFLFFHDEMRKRRRRILFPSTLLHH